MPDTYERDHIARGGPADMDRVAFGRMLREAHGASAADWVFSDQAEREAIHAVGLKRLIHAAGLSLATYGALRECSKARSDVLLRGAGALGIETDWRGWPA